MKNLKCLFGFHLWSIWFYRSINTHYYDFEEWEFRTCNRCGKYQERGGY